MGILEGALAAIAIIFLLLKLNLKRIAKHDIFLDICLTFFFIWIFAGTFAGMMVGLWAGAFISIFLFIAKRHVKHEELRWVRIRSFPYRKLAWVEVIDTQK